MDHNKRNDLLKHTIHTDMNHIQSQAMHIKHPLFNDIELIDRLMHLYSMIPITDLINTNTVVKDTSLSYIIVTDTFYILLIRTSTIRLVVRYNNNVYIDSIMKPNWSMDVDFTDNALYFKISSGASHAYLFYIKDSVIHFNTNMFKLNATHVKRIIAANR